MDYKLKFISLFVFNALIFSLVAHFLPFYFEVNDDVAMCWIANGTISGTPDCHLVFISAIYGSFLKMLYCIDPRIEWYTLCFAILHIVSVTIVVYGIMRNPKNRFWKYSLIVLFYALWFLCISRFQWTTTTALVTIAGVYVMLNRGLIYGCALILIATLIRFEVVAMIGIIVFPLIIYSFGRRWKSWLCVCFLFLTLLTVHYFDSLFYGTNDWKAYKEYNTIRGKVNDNPNNEVFNYADLPIGLTHNDIQLTLDFFPDPNVVTKKNCLK